MVLNTNPANATRTTTTSGNSNPSTEGFSPFTLDSSHVFYVHPSDSPGCQLVAVPFNGCGFVTWRSSILTSLSAKNKLGLIDGRNDKPAVDSPFFPYWERCNDMVKAWITNSVSREIATSVVCMKTAKEVWEDINQRFGNSNSSKYIQIQREIASTSQGSSDIATYFTKLRNLWDELNGAYVGPTCTCVALPKFIQDQQLFQFLSGLNDSHSTVKSNILMMHPLPSISKSYSLLQQDESQREILPSNSSFSSDSAAFLCSGPYNNPNKLTQKVNFESRRGVVPNGPNGSDARRGHGATTGQPGGLYCKYCKKTNHTIEKCYKLHGSDFKFTKPRKLASCVQTEVPLVDPTLPSVPKSIPAAAHGFSPEQLQQLQAMFHQAHLSSTGYGSGHISSQESGFAHFASLFTAYAVNSVGSHVCATSQLGLTPWILDSGATNHMTPHKHLLHNISPLPKPFLVTLPNGYKVKVISTGSLHLRNDIVLLNVLLVPSFHFNLISLHQLISQLNCVAVLTKHHCLLQGPSQKRPMVIGKVVGRLYYLHPDAALFPSSTSSSQVFSSNVCNIVPSDSSISACFPDNSNKQFNFVNSPKNFPATCAQSSTCNQASAVNKMDIFWHQRLGHMPFHKMASIPFLSNKVSSTQTFCLSSFPYG
ncbi:uncharacterized protein LOC132642117 [Lycium barbarum]|uniref:uncharacterized protein LOC132642117 n=1 Tax=Lycium barbarum TaxID=112863 RepID=UPI00293E3CBA|nr:uncharacterized protein LOC132642117 [Lycium barbarum]